MEHNSQTQTINPNYQTLTKPLADISGLVINQGTIAPFILGTYCVQSPELCVGITSGILKDKL